MAVNETSAQPRLTEQVAEEIRALLARRRISGRELARRMGASPSWVNFRLTGAQEIGLDQLQRFADALGVSVLDLMPGAGRVLTTAGDHADSQRVRINHHLADVSRRTYPSGQPKRTHPDRATRRPARTAHAHA